MPKDLMETSVYFFLNLSKEYITKMIKETHNLYFAEEQEILDSPILKFLQESENNDVLSNKQFLDIFPVQGNDFAHRCMYKNGRKHLKNYAFSYLWEFPSD